MFSLLCAACFDAREGCLDISATNFDVAADKDCCCTYPLLNANILHRIDTNPLTLGAKYGGVSGDSFAILDFAFYLSDFTVFRQNEAFYVQDTVRMGILKNSDTVYVGFRDDIIAVQRNNAPVHVIDTFPYQGIFDKITFRFGLKDSLLEVLRSEAPSGHPMGSGNRGLYNSLVQEYDGMWMNVVRFLPPNNQADTLMLRFSSSGLPADIDLFGTQTLVQKTGFDLTFTLEIDYLKWFATVDLQADEMTIKAQIRQNLLSGLRVY